MKQLNIKAKNTNLKLLGISLIVGLLVGLIVSFYRFLIHEIEHFLIYLTTIAQQNHIIYVFILGALIILGFIVGWIVKKEPLASGSGIPQVSAELNGDIEQNSLSVLSAKIFGGATSALAGLSIGREGPSIQMGAMLGKLVAKIFQQPKTSQRVLLTCGASAGLSAAFNAPLAGVLFALEELFHYFNKKILLATFAAAMMADYIAKLIFGNHAIFHFKINSSLPMDHYLYLILFGVVLSLFGILYFKSMVFFQKLNSKISIDLPSKMVIYFIVPIFGFIFYPNLLGGGNQLFQTLFNLNTVSLLLGVFLLKLIFSIFSFSSKVPGGIFFPILIMGALLGALFGKIFDPEYLVLYVIFGMAGYLTAIVRAPLTSIVLLLEMSGEIGYLLPLAIVCYTAYLILNYFEIEPIYEYLLALLIANKPNVSIHEQYEIEYIVEENSKIQNQQLKNITLPKECLIISIQRENQIIIPNGNTKLKERDIVVLHIYDSNNIKVLNEIFKGEQ